MDGDHSYNAVSVTRVKRFSRLRAQSHVPELEHTCGQDQRDVDERLILTRVLWPLMYISVPTVLARIDRVLFQVRENDECLLA
jgi:hypothetical protein